MLTRFGRPMANGAGIAADPTLTDAWSCPKTGTWHPMPSLPLRPKAPLPVSSPALAPASGSTLQSPRSGAPGPKALASVVGRPSTGGSAIELSVVGRGLERLHCKSGPKTVSAVPPRHPTGLVRSTKDVQCVPSSTFLPWTEALRMTVSKTHGQHLPCLSGPGFLGNFRPLGHLSGGSPAPFR